MVRPSVRRNPADLNQPLSRAELNELDEFLADESIEATSMDVSTLQGFLAAIVIGPRAVHLPEWLPWVWDMQEGQAEAKVDNREQADRIMSLLVRHYNTVVHTFLDDPASFEPVFTLRNQWGAAEWCEGFILGFQFSDEAWSLLSAEEPTWFAPFLRLGTDDGIHLTTKLGDAERWMNEVTPSLEKIHAYWKDKRVRQPGGVVQHETRLGGQKAAAQAVRGGPKIGRNDPCPCRSGKKFKKCCGAVDALGALH
ncbi:MAG TPA: YecA family protein [Candidatus Accumulibacter sp.]|nr:YecA family protein [Accumulibacter sp.]